MTVSTGYIRALLRGDYLKSIASGVDLLTYLQNQLTALVEATADGQIVSSTESDGSRVAFSNPRASGVTPSDMTEVRGLLIDLYDRAVTALGGSPGDAAIFGKMMDYLQPARRVRATYHSLRLS